MLISTVGGTESISKWRLRKAVNYVHTQKGDTQCTMISSS